MQTKKKCRNLKQNFEDIAPKLTSAIACLKFKVDTLKSPLLASEHIKVMGLDTVELVMAIEEQFAIEIPNVDASNLVIIGDLYDYVLRALRQRGESPDDAQVWKRFRAVVVRQLGVRPEQVVRSAHIVKDLKID